MKKDVVDLERYRDKAYLELCLEMVKDAQHYLKMHHYDLAAEQLADIMEAFDEKITEMKARRTQPVEIIPFHH